LVAQDVHGEKIGPVVRNGRLDKGMPAFAPTDEQLATIVAFIHDRKAKAKEGRRRTVDVTDPRPATPSGIAIFQRRRRVRQNAFTQRRPCWHCRQAQGLEFLGACSIQKKGARLFRGPHRPSTDRHRDAPLRPNHNREIGVPR